MTARILNRLSLMAIVVLLYSFYGCKPGKKLPTLTLKGDSGYVTKAEVLPFLLASRLTDTAQGYWRQRFNSDSDTIGKYYLANTAGNKIMLMQFYNKVDSGEELGVMEFNRQGILLAHEGYPMVDYWCDDHAIKTFEKKGRYFMITGCGHGSGFGSEYRYIFDHVVPYDKLNAIWFSCYNAFGIHYTGHPGEVSGEMSIADSGILLHYTFRSGEWDKNDDITWNVDKKADVLYTWATDHWTTRDSAVLEDIDMD